MNKLLITSIVFLLIGIAACGKSQSNDTVVLDEKIDTLNGVLDDLQVPYSGIAVNGKTVTITYEASSADQYDDQIIADWGMIMGAAADFPYDTIVIENTINGKNVARLQTTRTAVRSYLNETINDSVFWESVQITAAK